MSFGGITQPYKQLAPCVDGYGHRFKLDMVRAETAVCERCGLISKEKVQ
jgi:hypothetical protein